MSTTVTTVAAEEPRYEYFYRDSNKENKREILTGNRAVETFSEIPVVDVSRIFSEDFNVRLAVANEIADICKKVGFMYIKGHGIPQTLIDEVYDFSRRYHAQPSEVKMKQYVYNAEGYRGFNEHYVKTPEGPVCMTPHKPHEPSEDVLTGARQCARVLSCTATTQITTRLLPN